MKTINEIKKKCQDNGLNVHEVLRRAQAPKDTLHNWSKKEPKSFETKEKIENAITEMISEKP